MTVINLSYYNCHADYFGFMSSGTLTYYDSGAGFRMVVCRRFKMVQFYIYIYIYIYMCVCVCVCVCVYIHTHIAGTCGPVDLTIHGIHLKPQIAQICGFCFKVYAVYGEICRAACASNIGLWCM